MDQLKAVFLLLQLINILCLKFVSAGDIGTLQITKTLDPNDPLSIKLAEESLQTYLKNSGSQLNYKLGEITKITRTTVAGWLYKINFEIYIPDYFGSTQVCDSSIWVKEWEDFKQIDVDCEQKFNSQRSITDIKFGAPQDENPNDPFYFELASDSLLKYQADTGLVSDYHVARVIKATMRVISGFEYTVTFYISPPGLGEVDMVCNSRIWERGLSRTVEKVNCEPKNMVFRSKKRPSKNSIKKRPNINIPIPNIPIQVGGYEPRDPNDPSFIPIADMALQKYLFDTRSSKAFKLRRITQAAIQIVSGTNTKLDFIASVINSDESILCGSVTYLEPYAQIRQIQISCEPLLKSG